MSNGRSELLLYMAAAFATAIGLFVLHKWYATYIDVQYHAQLAQHGPSESAVKARQQDAQQLAGGKLPIDQAMQRLAQRGRLGFGTISPTPSEDLSALSGWIHRPGFKPVVAHPIRTPRAPLVVVTSPAEAPVPAPAGQPAQPPRGAAH
jgi:hypothetical protein